MRHKHSILTSVGLASLACVLLPTWLGAEKGASFGGHWVNRPYLEALKKTRSPLAAAAAAELVAILVDETPEGRQLSVTNFHEGLNYHLRGVESAAGGALLLVVDSLDDGEETLSQLRVQLTAGGDQLQAALWGEETLVYQRLDATLVETLNHWVLAGDYRDAHGKTWSFTPDGTARWPGRQGTYDIVLDLFDSDCDQLSFSDAKNPDELSFYGFRRQGRQILLYELVQDSDEVPLQCAPKPFATLSP